MWFVFLQISLNFSKFVYRSNVHIFFIINPHIPGDIPVMFPDFINQLLSDTATYNINGQDKTKSEIEWFDFNRKIREVIPAISGNDYINNYKQDYDNLSLTNSLRDDLIHLKRVETDNFTNYETLFKRLLDFDPVNASNTVFNFVNTIKQDYFEEQE